MPGWIKEQLRKYPIADHRDVHVICIFFPDGLTEMAINTLKPALKGAYQGILMQLFTINSFSAITEGVEERISLTRRKLESLRKNCKIRQFHIGECRGEYSARNPTKIA